MTVPDQHGQADRERRWTAPHGGEWV